MKALEGTGGLMHTRGVFSRAVYILFLIIVSTNRGYSQDVTDQALRLMFYNVENLFDIYDDSLKDDNDFLPQGLMRWNYSRYTKKINSLYKTIIAVGEWHPPDVLALCEVENRKVLEDLVYGTYLSKYKFGIVHEDSPDERGIDVCLIFRKDRLELINYEYWIPSGFKSGEFTSRSVLYAKLRSASDTLHIIVNHWPSRRGGVLSAEGDRQKIAAMVKTRVDSIVNNSGYRSKIIIMGDFNCSPDDQAIRLLVEQADSDPFMVNLSERDASDGKGTYRYLGIWEMIDQIIISPGLLNSDYGLYTNDNLFSIFKPDFLLFRDPKYPGLTPFSTYRGYRYQGGYSDHLPVVLDLIFPDQHQQE